MQLKASLLLFTVISTTFAHEIAVRVPQPDLYWQRSSYFLLDSHSSCSFFGVGCGNGVGSRPFLERRYVSLGGGEV